MWQSNSTEIQFIRKMVMTSCKHDLVGNYFEPKKYISCIVAKYVDDKLVLVFEFILNVKEDLCRLIKRRHFQN